MNGVHGRPRISHFLDIEYLKHLIRHRPDWFLDELQYLLQTNCFIATHFTTVHWELVQAGISAKKIKKVAAERNDDLQADLLLAWLSTYLNNLAFLTRFQRMNAHLLGLMDDLVKESELS